jgi:hypothetical protein
VREAIIDDRAIVSDHAELAAEAMNLTREDLLTSVARGFVLPQVERDEGGTAVDGYKHFLEALTPAGAIIEVVFKIVETKIWPGEEIVILITTYRGRA